MITAVFILTLMFSTKNRLDLRKIDTRAFNQNIKNFGSLYSRSYSFKTNKQKCYKETKYKRAIRVCLQITQSDIYAPKLLNEVKRFSH